MSSDRMKRDYRHKLALKGQASLDLTPPAPPALIKSHGRYVRFSHRYNTWQVNRKNPAGQMEWHNISVNLARVYAAAGLPIGVHV